MNTLQAADLKARIEALLLKYNNPQVWPATTPKPEILTEMLVALDPVREFFKPYLVAEYDKAFAEAKSSLLKLHGGDDDSAGRMANEVPSVKALFQQKESFLSTSRPYLPDIEKAVRILTQYLVDEKACYPFTS